MNQKKNSEEKKDMQFTLLAANKTVSLQHAQWNPVKTNLGS